MFSKLCSLEEEWYDALHEQTKNIYFHQLFGMDAMMLNASGMSLKTCIETALKERYNNV
jgi:hypothetical protein